MENHTYETFEFIEPNSPNNTEISPLYVLQEDGTILSVNREIQYVTQIEDGKENVQHCNVFDVSSQRYYVDVNNTTELIAVPDQFVTPSDEDNINSYLIQPETTAICEQMETDVLIESNPETLDTDGDTTTISKSVHTGFTEITLNNDQYQMLEQKGWILLECYDKIFVLNTLGLHDITENETRLRYDQKYLDNARTYLSIQNNNLGLRFSINTFLPLAVPHLDMQHLKLYSLNDESGKELVSKLKSEVQAFNVTTQLEELNDKIDVKIEDHAPDLQEVEIKELEKFEKTESEVQQPEVGSIMEDHSVGNPVVLDTAMNIEGEKGENKSTVKPEDTQIVKEDGHQEKREITSPVPEEFENEMCCNTLKIKTKSIFTDVPHKIYLGKTAAGKKLFAKVTKSKLNRIKNNNNLKILCEKKIDHYSALTEAQFISIVQDWFRGSTHINQLNVTEAEAIMTQLVKLSQIKQAIMGHKIILTKILINTDAEGKTTNEQRPIVITGIIKQTEDGKGQFVYDPKMLQELPPPEEKPKKDLFDYEIFDEAVPNHMIDIFHIHIAESKIYDKPPNQTIQITKRKLSLNVLNDAKKRHPDPVYACGACAAVFKSEPTLKEHQESKCFAEDALTIDTDGLNVFSESYHTIEDGKKKVYECTQCEAKFTRLFNCQKHIKTHDIPNRGSDSESNKNGTETDDKTPRKVYKCAMCSSTYFHPSSLSKHIVKMHIHVK